jgi:hypothetical protein
MCEKISVELPANSRMRKSVHLTLNGKVGADRGEAVGGGVGRGKCQSRLDELWREQESGSRWKVERMLCVGRSVE